MNTSQMVGKACGPSSRNLQNSFRFCCRKLSVVGIAVGGGIVPLIGIPPGPPDPSTPLDPNLSPFSSNEGIPSLDAKRFGGCG